MLLTTSGLSFVEEMHTRDDDWAFIMLVPAFSTQPDTQSLIDA